MFKPFKLIIIGDSCVGKTSYCNKLINNSFNSNYTQTKGKNVLTLNICNQYLYKLWDCEPTTSMDKYYSDSDFGIIMTDINNKETFKNIEKYIFDFKKICPLAPLAIVRNKNDDMDLNTLIDNDKHLELCGVRCIDISVKTGYQIYEPIGYLFDCITISM